MTLDQAYDLLQSRRPIIRDRRRWHRLAQPRAQWHRLARRGHRPHPPGAPGRAQVLLTGVRVAGAAGGGLRLLLS